MDSSSSSSSLTPTPRRGFLASSAAAVALLLTGTARGADGAPEKPKAGEEWLSRITGKHKQFFDATSTNEGFPFGFAMTFLNTNKAAYSLGDRDLTAIVGLRHFAIPMALSDDIWKKYKLGEMFNIKDKATTQIAERNVFSHVKEGDLMTPDMAVDKMMARGVIVTVCNVALTVLSGMRAPVAGVTPAAAYEEWKAALAPGVFIVPSGVLAVNRAQERGCTYCFAG